MKRLSNWLWRWTVEGTSEPALIVLRDANEEEKLVMETVAQFLRSRSISLRSEAPKVSLMTVFFEIYVGACKNQNALWQSSLRNWPRLLYDKMKHCESTEQQPFKNIWRGEEIIHKMIPVFFPPLGKGRYYIQDRYLKGLKIHWSLGNKYDHCILL